VLSPGGFDTGGARPGEADIGRQVDDLSPATESKAVAI
jgi:hypothetical protein